MPPIDPEAAEALRTFALEHNEIAFAHLVTAALDGEVWAVARIDWVLREIARTIKAAREEFSLQAIRATDTTRPDGAVARSIEAP